MANEAMARGLAGTTPNPAHKRSVLVQLTSQGSAVIDALIAHERTLLGQVPGDLTYAEIAACLRVLNCLLDYLGDDDLS